MAESRRQNFAAWAGGRASVARSSVQGLLAQTGAALNALTRPGGLTGPLPTSFHTAITPPMVHVESRIAVNVPLTTGTESTGAIVSFPGPPQTSPMGAYAVPGLSEGIYHEPVQAGPSWVARARYAPFDLGDMRRRYAL